MIKSLVFNIQHYSLHDGPGIRTIVFLKGCPMRCRWCCNPESQKYNSEISYVENKCIGLGECGFCGKICKEKAISFSEKAVIDMSKCSACLKCADVCPSRAIKTEGREYSESEILDIVQRDSAFFNYGGGITISGGEPLTHGDFLIGILKEAKKRRINTAVETCGYADYNVLYEAAEYLDTILYDIKSINSEKHREFTGCGNEKILDNFAKMCADYPKLNKKVRTPVIPGFNDSIEDIKAIKEFIGGRPNISYELLPYHTFGRGKYKALGRDYPMGNARLDMKKYEELTGNQ